MVVFSALLSDARGDVCVWRDPERTMQRIFPEARDYKTVTFKMTPERITSIESALGEKLDESEKREFDLYEIHGASGKLGWIMALAGKGEYGAIEVVIGIHESGAAAGAYIQRSRERVTKALRSVEFLDQFVGKSQADAWQVGSDVQPPSAETEQAARVVAATVRKMLVIHAELTKGEQQ